MRGWIKNEICINWLWGIAVNRIKAVGNIRRKEGNMMLLKTSYKNSNEWLLFIGNY